MAEYIDRDKALGLLCYVDNEEVCTHNFCPNCGDELAVAKLPPMTEVIGKASIMLADEVCMAREILVLLEGGKTEPPPPCNPTCLRDDAMSLLDKAHTLYNVLNQIKSALGG